MTGRGKESPHLSRCEQADDDIPVVQVDNAFLHDTGNKDAKVTFLTMVDNNSGQMVATAAHLVERSRVIRSDWRDGASDRQRNGTDRRCKHVAAERKATTIIRQTPKKSSQSNAYVERAHQSVEAHTRLSATDSITSWMIRHAAFLQACFCVGKARDDITKITRASFCHLDQLMMRKSETRTLNAANSIPIHSRHLAWKSRRERRAHCRNSTRCLHSKVGSSEERSGNLEQWSHQEYERHFVGTAGRGQSSGSSDARKAAQTTNDRLEHQHEISQRFLGRDGQDGRMRGMRKPRRHEAQCCLSEPARGVEDQDRPTIRTSDT